MWKIKSALTIQSIRLIDLVHHHHRIAYTRPICRATRIITQFLWVIFPSTRRDKNNRRRKKINSWTIAINQFCELRLRKKKEVFAVMWDYNLKWIFSLFGVCLLIIILETSAHLSSNAKRFTSYVLLLFVVTHTVQLMIK